MKSHLALLLALALVGACQMMSGLDGLNADRHTDPQQASDAGPDADAGSNKDHGGAATGGKSATGKSGSDAADGGAGGAGGDRANPGGKGGHGGSGGAGGEHVDPDPKMTAGKGGQGGSGGSGPETCSPPVSGGACDTAPQCGCQQGENCLFYESRLACVMAGETAAYGACDGYTDCQRGFQCLGGACKRLCDQTAPQCDAPGIKCEQISNNNTPLSGGYFCPRMCNLVSPQLDDAKFDACGPGLNCARSTTDGQTDCVTANPKAAPGEACTASRDCAPGYVCASNKTCRKWCAQPSDCASDQLCDKDTSPVTIAEIKFGSCRSMCEPPVAGGTCDTTPQCGCASDQRCDFTKSSDGTWNPSCMSVGTVATWSQCSSSAPCGKGDSCIGGICQTFCENTAATSCEGGKWAFCQTISASGNELPGYFTCSKPCNPEDPERAQGEWGACGQGRRCLPTSNHRTICLQTKESGTQEASCDNGSGSSDVNACAQGFICMTPMLKCAHLCLLSDKQCAEGTCKAFTTSLFAGDIEYGYCSTAGIP